MQREEGIAPIDHTIWHGGVWSTAISVLSGSLEDNVRLCKMKSSLGYKEIEGDEH